MNSNLTLGVLYRRANPFWNIDYFTTAFKAYKNLNLKFFDVTEQSVLINSNNSIYRDLDGIILLPAESDYLKSILSSQNKIKWVHSMFAGVDKFLSIKELAENECITLTNSRGAFAESLAEFGIFSMLYFYYNTPVYQKSFSERKWTQPLNKMVKDKTLTIVGYGQNGVALARKAKLAFNLKVIGVRKEVNTDLGKEFVDEIYSNEMINDIIPRTDFLVSFLPHTKETINFFDKSKFSLMKPSSVFINLGRGSSVVEEHLIHTLKNGDILGAVLDVTQEEPLKSASPLFDLDNIYLSFHSADNTEDYFKQAVDVLKKNLDSYFNEGKLLTVVDIKKGY